MKLEGWLYAKSNFWGDDEGIGLGLFFFFFFLRRFGSESGDSSRSIKKYCYTLRVGLEGLTIYFFILLVVHHDILDSATSEIFGWGRCLFYFHNTEEKSSIRGGSSSGSGTTFNLQPSGWGEFWMCGEWGLADEGRPWILSTKLVGILMNMQFIFNKDLNQIVVVEPVVRMSRVLLNPYWHLS